MSDVSVRAMVPLPKAEEARAETSLLAVIASAATDPRVDVDKMERLLAMQRTIMAEQRQTAFAAALSRLQAKLPQINKAGKIIVSGLERSRYAKIEDIDRAIRPLLAEEGFALSFDSASPDAKVYTMSCRLSHSEGHSETKVIALPLDASPHRSTVQSVGSTVSYARRLLMQMHLNLVAVAEDDDGQGGSLPITEDQAKDLHSMLTEVHADTARFLTFMGVDAVKSILARDYKRAISALEAKRRRQQ
mgnify:CR=1 FL=1